MPPIAAPATNAYTTARSAASVTVVSPLKIPPKSITGSPVGTAARRAARQRSARVAGALTGHCCRLARIAMRPRSTAASTNAGRKPARNNVTIDRLTSDPRTTIVKHGGTRIPMADAAATILTDSVPL